jgi:HEAT repeat protein
VTALGELHEGRAEGPLVKLLEHPEADVREAAAAALGDI